MGRARFTTLISLISNPNQSKDLASLSSPSSFRRFCVATAEAADLKEASPLSAQPSRSKKPIYYRFSALGFTGKSVSQTLNQYFRNGRSIEKKKFELQACIRGLRKLGNNQHAVEVYEWLKNKNVKFSYGDHAIFLNLISKTKGIKAAEDYFSCLLLPAKNVRTYGSLFSCYCKEGLMKKALSLFEKMDELGFVTCLAFTDLMALYLKLGQPEKVPPLVDEMERRNINLDAFTYNMWMNSLAAMDDITGAEKVFAEIQVGESKHGWSIYGNLASIYVKAGLHEKANPLLKKIEEIEPDDRRAYHFVISLYAAIDDLEGVKRVWGFLKSKFSTCINASYRVTLQAFAKLKNVDELKKCFEEWELARTGFDKRLIRVAIGAYLALDLVDDAEQVLYRATQRSSPPFDLLRQPFILFFLKSREEERVLKHLEASIAESKERSRSSSHNMLLVEKLFSHLKEGGDVDGAEVLCKIFKKLDILDATSYQFLVQVYISARKLAPDLRRRIQEDKFEITSELENLLKMVSS